MGEQVARGDSPVFAVMLESQLVAGSQAAGHGRSLVYGQSITDACIDMATTEPALAALADAVRRKRSTGGPAR